MTLLRGAAAACHAYWTIENVSDGMPSVHSTADFNLIDKVLILHGILAWRSFHPDARMVLVTDRTGRDRFARNGLIDLYDDVSLALDELDSLPQIDKSRYFSLGKLFAAARACPGAAVFDLDLYLLAAPSRPRWSQLLVAHAEAIEPGGVYVEPARLCHGHEACFADLNRRLPAVAQNMAFYWPGSPAVASAVLDVALAFAAAHSGPRAPDVSEVSYVLHAEQRLPAAVAGSMGGGIGYLSERTWWPGRNGWIPEQETPVPFHHMWVQQKALHDAFPERRLGYLWLMLVELIRRFPDTVSHVHRMAGDDVERSLVDYVTKLAPDDLPRLGAVSH